MQTLLLIACLCTPVFQTTNKAVVYFYRLEESPFSGNYKLKVYIDGRLALMMPESEFIGIQLAPGRHKIRLARHRHVKTALTVLPGATYIFRVRRTGDSLLGRSLAKWGQLWMPLGPQARLELSKMKGTLGDENIKRKDLEVVREMPQ